MKKIILIIISATLILPFAGCEQKSESTEDTPREDTIKVQENIATKEELVGTWVVGAVENGTIEFTSEGTAIISGKDRGEYDIVGNWIVVGEVALYYEFIDGKLFLNSTGYIFTKEK